MTMLQKMYFKRTAVDHQSAGDEAALGTRRGGVCRLNTW